MKLYYMPEDQPLQADIQADSITTTSAEKLHNLETEKENAWSKFMDDMQIKLPQTGPYFLSLGGKRRVPGFEGNDNRAFVLIKPVFDKDKDTAQYVVISRKGARGARQKDIESNFYESLDNVRKGFPQNLQKLSMVVINQQVAGPPSLLVRGEGTNGSFFANIAMDSDMEEQAVKDAIRGSTELVKTSAAEYQVTKANSLSAFLDTLSPGETGPSAPTAPPTPSTSP